MFASAVTSVNCTGGAAGSSFDCGGALRQAVRYTRLRSVIVNRLSLIVILGTQLSGASRQLLRSLIRFEALEQSLLALGLVGLPQPPVAEHQIVMCLKVFGIHSQRLFQGTDGFLVTALEEQDASSLI